MMKSTDKLSAGSQMLIRKPASEVFEALVDPEITSRFWFTESSGRLEKGKNVEWTWEQFGVSATITVTDIKKDRLIKFKWPSEGEASRTVEISFESQADRHTLVEITEDGFDKEDEMMITKTAGQTEGWVLVLSVLKTYVEHNAFSG